MVEGKRVRLHVHSADQARLCMQQQRAMAASTATQRLQDVPTRRLHLPPCSQSLSRPALGSLVHPMLTAAHYR